MVIISFLFFDFFLFSFFIYLAKKNSTNISFCVCVCFFSLLYLLIHYYHPSFLPFWYVSMLMLGLFVWSNKNQQEKKIMSGPIHDNKRRSKRWYIALKCHHRNMDSLSSMIITFRILFCSLPRFPITSYIWCKRKSSFDTKAKNEEKNN